MQGGEGDARRSRRCKEEKAMQGGAALGEGDVGEGLKGVGAAVSSCFGPGACSSVIIGAPESFQSRRG